LLGKLIILGYLGICPNVEIAVPRLDQPTVLTFLLGGSPGNGRYNASFEILDEAHDTLIAAAAQSPFSASPSTRTNISTTLIPTFAVLDGSC